ncbi:GIY-YIG nuclease family protein [Echinicola jeungdonensis]|uniref:GIY-YIG nuclease family protein n=1 Tax=Echinicola jeungdonensis TaxID=709343 RepID=A0ABV5J6N9_9BACT|nr:GIY-YIG nuclease family protein [Echinicola jeungdonensis]MDN3667865.1 GIY-YIG nuclease family protein [Echinicola jeungdonensis]
MKKGGCIYIMTNKNNTTLYVGVTAKLESRVYQHKNNEIKSSFSFRYHLSKLVYFESFHSIEEAISREKQLKAGSRQKKLDLINSSNPEWKDLYDEL